MTTLELKNAANNAIENHSVKILVNLYKEASIWFSEQDDKYSYDSESELKNHILSALICFHYLGIKPHTESATKKLLTQCVRILGETETLEKEF